MNSHKLREIEKFGTGPLFPACCTVLSFRGRQSIREGYGKFVRLMGVRRIHSQNVPVHTMLCWKINLGMKRCCPPIQILLV